MTKYRFKPGKPEPGDYDYDPDQTISEYEHDIALEHGLYDNQREQDIDDYLPEDLTDWEKDYEQWIESLLKE